MKRLFNLLSNNIDTSVSVGSKAEVAVVKCIKKKGYQLIDRNWKNQHCEIDIVARKREVIVFIEVKYRSNDNNGRGLDYITPTKLRQMEFAAEYWVSSNEWEGEYYLAAAEVSGIDFRVTNLVEI